MTRTGGGLRSIRVIDLSDESGCYGTKVMADLGADVIRIEPPGGSPLRERAPFIDDGDGQRRSLYFAAMCTSAGSVVADLDTAEGRAVLGDLVDTADVVYYSGSTSRYEELRLGELRTGRDTLVLTSVTPFGLSGPMASWSGSDLVAWAMGGLAVVVGDPDRAPLAPAPAAELAYVLAGQFAALSTLAAVRHARRTGGGQGVDVSIQESVVAVSGESGVLTGFLDDLIPRGRPGSRRRTTAPFGHYPTSDGSAAVMSPMPAHWEALSNWIYDVTGNDGVLDPSLKGGPQSRAGDMADVVNVYTEDLTTRYTRQELFEEGQKRGIPITPTNDAASVLADPQLQERDFWAELDIDGRTVRAPGSPYRLGRCVWRATPAPGLGESAETDRAIDQGRNHGGAGA